MQSNFTKFSPEKQSILPPNVNNCLHLKTAVLQARQQFRAALEADEPIQARFALVNVDEAIVNLREQRERGVA